MRILGSLLRYLFNINTIWGLMILISFALCVAGQYLPTKTVVPADRLRAGANALIIRLKDLNDKVDTFEYQVVLGADGLSIPADHQVRRKERPCLISAKPVGNGFLLTWDHEGYGKYEVVVNGSLVRRGTLAKLQGLTDAGFEYAKKGFVLAFGLVSSMVLFLGLMKVGEDAGVVGIVARVFHPMIRFIFPGIPREHPANGAILMNITTSILGLGNAATPMGLKAMKELDSLNPHPGIATDAQVTLLALNTGGLALLPTTLLAARKAAGCSDPFEVIGTCLVAGAVSSVVAVIVARLLAKLPLFSIRAALEEEAVRTVLATAEAGGNAKEEK
jgi:spore maturation protein A